MIHKGKDLSPEERVALERLVGRSISDQEDISVRVLQPSSEISPKRRQEILAELNAFFARVDAQRKPVSAEQANEIIDEALRSARPGYRSHR
jgi:hypothetical protein